MDAFRGKLKGSFLDDGAGDEDSSTGPKAGDADGEGEEDKPEEENTMEVDDDVGFLSHKLFVPNDNNIVEVEKAERDYEVIDPRQRGARAREEERERRKKIKPRDGGRGSRR